MLLKEIIIVNDLINVIRIIYRKRDGTFIKYVRKYSKVHYHVSDKSIIFENI